MCVWRYVLHMFVYMCAHRHICLYVYAHKFVYLCLYACVNAYMVHMFMCMYMVYTYVCAGVFACMCAWYVCVHVCVKHMCLCGSVYMQRLEANAGIFYRTSSTILPSVLR